MAYRMPRRFPSLEDRPQGLQVAMKVGTDLVESRFYPAEFVICLTVMGDPAWATHFARLSLITFSTTFARISYGASVKALVLADPSTALGINGAGFPTQRFDDAQLLILRHSKILTGTLTTP